jgi:8-oxo-dGTP diphosphatase
VASFLSLCPKQSWYYWHNDQKMSSTHSDNPDKTGEPPPSPANPTGEHPSTPVTPTGEPPAPVTPTGEPPAPATPTGEPPAPATPTGEPPAPVTPTGEPPWTAVNSAGYAAPAALAVDIAVLTVRDHRLVALVLTRPDGTCALPGGLVGAGESPGQTAARKLTEKTGVADVRLEQLATFAQPGRDPRGWIPTVAHLALVPPATEPTDPAAAWVPADTDRQLAFDHGLILATAVDRVRGKLWWSNIAAGILPGPFAIAEARDVYEAIAQTTYDPATFSRDLRATGLIAATGDRREQTGGRPAALYGFIDRRPTWGAGRSKRVRVD